MEAVWRGTRAAPVQPVGLLVWLLAGIPIGLLFLVALQLDRKWFVSLFLGGVILAVSLAPMDRKALYLFLLAFTIPLGLDYNLFFQWRPVHHSTYGIAIILFYFPMTVLYVMWAFRCWSHHVSPGISTRGLTPLAGFFSAAVASVILGGNPLFGSFDLFALLWSIALFAYASSEIRSRSDLQIVVGTLLGTVWLQGVIAVGQHLTGSTLGLDFFGAGTSVELRGWQGLAALTRVGGTIGAPNALALFLDPLLPLGFALLFCPLRRHTKCLLGAAVGMGMLGMTLTLSRGGMVGTGAGCLLILGVWLQRRIGFLRLLCVASILVALLLVLTFGTTNLIQERFLRDDYQAAYGRVPLMKVALNMIRHQPFFGVGLNNYSEVAPRYDNTPERINSQWNIPVHNLFLYIAAEVGLVGLICYVFFLTTVLRALWPALRARDPFVAWAGLGVAVGIVVVFTHLQVELVSLVRESNLWFVSGLAVSLGRLAGPPAAKTDYEP